MTRVIHYNPAMSHQVDHAEAFMKCGFGATSGRDCEADIHVVSGNWYAYNQWRDHPRCLMIDRAWWGDPHHVSIGWTVPGSKKRKFASGTKPRQKPEYEPWKTRESSALVLADYGQDVTAIVAQAYKRFAFVEVRKHPANETRPQAPLEHAIRLRDVVICSSGTAGFEAIMQGKPVICLDPDSELMPVCVGDMDAELYRGDRDEWLHDMSYKQFSLAEIADGTAWNLLKDIK